MTVTLTTWQMGLFLFMWVCLYWKLIRVSKFMQVLVALTVTEFQLKHGGTDEEVQKAIKEMLG